MTAVHRNPVQDNPDGAAVASAAHATSEHMASAFSTQVASMESQVADMRTAELHQHSVNVRREPGTSELSSAEFRLCPEALAAEAPLLAALSSSPLDRARAVPDNSAAIMGEDVVGLRLGCGALEQTKENAAAQNAADEAALRLQLVAVRGAASIREQELKELQLPSDLAEWGVSEAIDPSEEEALLREAEEVRRLEEAIQEADQCIEEYEGRLRIYDAAGGCTSSGETNGCSIEKFGWRSGSEAPSLASTAPTSTAAGPASADTMWQDRAKALEREIRSESAMALELQDRIHWLRGQIRRQPGDQDERIIAIRKLFEQVRDKMDLLAVQSSQAARKQLLC